MFLALGQSLADEAAARPDTVRSAIRTVVRWGQMLQWCSFNGSLARGKYGKELREEAHQAVFRSSPDLCNAPAALAEVVWHQSAARDTLPEMRRVAEYFQNELQSTESVRRCEGILGLMHISFRLVNGALSREEVCNVLCESGPTVVSILNAEHIVEQYVAVWALAWLGESRVWHPPLELDLHSRLYRLWKLHPDQEFRRVAAWALASQPLMARDKANLFRSITDADFEDLANKHQPARGSEGYLALLVIAWYRRTPWDDAELGQRVLDANSAEGGWGLSATLQDLAQQLGVTLPDERQSTQLVS